MSEVYVVSAMRSAIGGFGGSLKDMPPHELGAAVIKAAIEKAGITGDDVNLSLIHI